MNDNNLVKPNKNFVSRRKAILKKVFLNYGLLLLGVVLFFIFSMLQPRFASLNNILNLCGQGSIIGMLALGLTYIVISGEFDISFASIATLTSILSFQFVGMYHFPLLLAYLLILIIGVSVSMINGFNVVYIGMPSFVATLGMMGILTGVSKWITGGKVLYMQLPESFSIIGGIKIGGLLPSAFVSFLIVAFIVTIIVELTFKGRHLYAVGCNSEAAKRVGIDVSKVKFGAFLLMGVIASFAGLVAASNFGIGNPDMSNSFLFPAIIATMLGAVFLREGVPNIIGTVVAAMLFAEINNGLIMVGTQMWVKELMNGVILLTAVTLISILKPGGIPDVKIG